ncbi:reverse transcriptase domain-containing protein [Tanacetum coccineum]
MSGCRDSQKVKYTAGSFVGKALTWWNSQIHTQGREAVVGMYAYGLAPQIRGMVAATEPMTIQKAVQIAEPSKDRNGRDDNKRTRTVNAFATTTNPVRRENTGAVPKCTTCNTHHPPEAPCRACFNCNRPGHFAKDCRVVPRNVNPINARNLTVRACYECSSVDHIRAFMLGAEEAHQDSNIVMVEIDKVIKGCKLEIDAHVFDINLIPFGSGSFDVIIGMDWLSDHKAEIICHEKVVRIPLLDGKVLRVLGGEERVGGEV